MENEKYYALSILVSISASIFRMQSFSTLYLYTSWRIFISRWPGLEAHIQKTYVRKHLHRQRSPSKRETPLRGLYRVLETCVLWNPMHNFFTNVNPFLHFIFPLICWSSLLFSAYVNVQDIRAKWNKNPGSIIMIDFSFHCIGTTIKILKQVLT